MLGRIYRKTKTTIYKMFNLKFWNCKLYDVPKIYFKKHIKVGKNTAINDGVFINGDGGVDIGENCIISHGVTILSTELDIVNWKNRDVKKDVHISKKIIIGNNVWLCANVTVCPGVVIGDNTVIAAGAVVVDDCEKDCLYAGVPAKLVRRL